MQICALVALLACGSVDLQDGSLLFLEGGNKPVAVVTGSAVTHVAVVRTIGESPWVYEASPAEVRRVPLSTYCREIAELNERRSEPIRVWVLAPQLPYPRVQQLALHGYLEHQLGRRYSLQGYVRKREAEGVHCAQFAATALYHAGRVRLQARHRLSPADLFRLVQPWYGAPQQLDLPAARETGTWCQRSWNRWFTRLDWCNWACRETWAMCW